MGIGNGHSIADGAAAAVVVTAKRCYCSASYAGEVVSAAILSLLYHRGLLDRRRPKLNNTHSKASTAVYIYCQVCTLSTVCGSSV